MTRADRGATARLLCALAWGWASLCGGACAATPVPPPEPVAKPLRVVSDPLVLPLARGVLRLAPEVTAERPLAGEEASAFAGLLRGEVDVVFALRRPSADERREAAGRDIVDDVPLVARRIARDHLALIVTGGLPISVLSLADARAILSGSRTTWDGLGVSGPTRVIATARGSSAWRAAAAAMPDLTPAPGFAAVATDDQVVRRVSAAPGALGIASLSGLRGAQAIALVIDTQELRPGETDWPIVRDVFIVTRGTSRRVDALVAAARSEAGRTLVRERGFALVSEGTP